MISFSLPCGFLFLLLFLFLFWFDFSHQKDINQSLVNSRLKMAGVEKKHSNERGTERLNDCLPDHDHHLGRSKDIYSWIVNRLLPSSEATKATESRTRGSATKPKSSKYLSTESNSEGTNKT